MAGTESDQDYSIDEILASIRQIITDDETREAGDIEVPQEEKFEIPVYEPEPEEEEAPRILICGSLYLAGQVLKANG